MSTPDPVVALAAELERLSRRVDGATERAAARADEHEEHIRVLAEAVSTLARPGPGGPPVDSWLAPARPAAPPDDSAGPVDDTDRADEQTGPLPGPEAARDLADLAWWIGRVYLRYPAARLPSCWAWHPAVVEELRWLRGAHADAYTGRGASWAKVGDWHDRLRPGVVRRVEQWIGGCELSEHTEGRDHADPTPPTAPLEAHLAAVALTWADLREAPVPTHDQLVEAANVHGVNGYAR